MIVDKFPEFKRLTEIALGKSAEDAGQRIYARSSKYVPVGRGAQGGTLKRSPIAGGPKRGPVQKISKKEYVIGYYVPYAAYQHRGMRYDGTRVVKRYSKPGSRKEFLLQAAREVQPQLPDIIKKYMSLIRI